MAPRVRPFRVHVVALAVLCGLLVGSARGDEPTIIQATYRGTAEGHAFDYTTASQERFVKEWKAHNGAFTREKVGRLDWQVPLSEPTTGGMGREFSTFCAEVHADVVAGRTYRFEVTPPNVPAAFGLEDDEPGRTEADRRATFVRELFGRYYLPTLKDKSAAAAFQVALWEIIHESELPAAPDDRFSLFGGTFRAGAPALEAAPKHVQVAEGYLNFLTGNNTPYYENDDLQGLELVRLRGLRGTVDGLYPDYVPQSQFAVRYKAGAGMAGRDSSRGGSPSPGTPDSGAGTGRGDTQGQGTGLGTGLGSGLGVGLGSPLEIVPFTAVQPNPPISGPGTGGQPPGPQPPDIVAPAPPAVVLAVVAVGLLAGRRVIRRNRV